MSNNELSYSIDLNNRITIKEAYKEKLKKYSTDETVDSLEENLDSILSAPFNMIIFPIVSTVVALIISIVFGNINNSIFGLLMFLSLIPLVLVGVGAFGIAKTLSDYYNGVLYILRYIISVTIEVRKSAKDDDLPPLKVIEIAELILKIVVLPVIKKKFRNNLFGGIIYFVLKKTILRAPEECFESSLQLENLRYNLDNNKGKVKLLNSVHPFIINSLNLLLKIVTFILICIGFISSIISIVSLFILFS